MRGTRDAVSIMVVCDFSSKGLDLQSRSDQLNKQSHHCVILMYNVLSNLQLTNKSRRPICLSSLYIAVAEEYQSIELKRTY